VRRARCDCVGEEIAVAVLLIIGESPPRLLRCSRQPRRASGRRDPTRCIALCATPVDRRAVAVESSGGAKLEPVEEIHDAPRLATVAGRRERDRGGAGVAGPDVGPALARAGQNHSAALVGEGMQDKQRAEVHPSCPPRGVGPQRPGRRKPTRVRADQLGVAQRADGHLARAAEVGDCPQRVGSRQIALPNAVGPRASRAKRGSDRKKRHQSHPSPQRSHRSNASSPIAFRSLAFALRTSMRPQAR